MTHGARREDLMKCPRCSSNSVVGNHRMIGCIACGHVIDEPSREAWDAASSIRGARPDLGPPVTAAERAGFAATT
jgi:transcription initiation factor TFIIIB Brf1 subunit/transcription initiation factor TFIIB